MKKQITVVGGGIIGLSCAYYLLKDGHQVRVIDRSTMEEGASYVNAGYLTPSHIIPLSSPGMMTQGLKWMFKSDSPFYLKPRLDPEFLRWSWFFHRSSTVEHVRKAIPIIRDINVLSKELYEEILKSGDLGPFQLDKVGLLMLYKDPELGKHEEVVMKEVKALGLDAEKLDRLALEQLQPGLHPQINEAVHYRCDVQTTPTQFMSLLKSYLISKGVEICKQEEVQNFTIKDGTIASVFTDQNEYKTEAVVLAGGVWTSALSHKLGIKLSLQAGKGYCINIHRPTPIQIPAILMEAKVAVSPMEGFTRFAGTMELSGINTRIRRNRVVAIARAATSYYQNLEIQAAEIDSAAAGLRPLSPDGLPFIGSVPNMSNAYIATGHAMMGWSLGPASGKLIADLIADRKPSMPLKGMEPGRKF